MSRCTKLVAMILSTHASKLSEGLWHMSSSIMLAPCNQQYDVQYIQASSCCMDCEMTSNPTRDPQHRTPHCRHFATDATVQKCQKCACTAAVMLA